MLLEDFQAYSKQQEANPAFVKKVKSKNTVYWTQQDHKASAKQKNILCADFHNV